MLGHGQGYLNIDIAIGSSITFNILARTAGTAIASFRYSNGATADRTGQIRVNGVTGSSMINFPITGTFTDSKAIDVSVKN